MLKKIEHILAVWQRQTDGAGWQRRQHQQRRCGTSAGTEPCVGSDQEGSSGDGTMKARDFQARTIQAALKSLTGESGSRRFLVADEVRIRQNRRGQRRDSRHAREGFAPPVKVMYVCANLVIARQNVRRLLGFLQDEAQRAPKLWQRLIGRACWCQTCCRV